MAAILGVLSACVVLFIGGYTFLRHRTRLLKTERAGEDFETFARHFLDESVREETLRAVYSHFQGWIGDAEFPVRPPDSISGVYGIVEEDFHDLVNGMVSRFGSDLPTPGEIKQIETVEDLVRMLAR